MPYEVFYCLKMHALPRVAEGVLYILARMSLVKHNSFYTYKEIGTRRVPSDR